MNKGKTFRRLMLARLSVMAAALTICLPAQAQQGAPEVYVDMGVLQGLGAQPQQAPQPIKLKPPTPKPPAAQGMPSLIAPSAPPPEQPPPQAAAPAPVAKPAPKPVVNAVAVEPPKPAPVLPKPAPKTPYVSKAPDMPDNMPLKSAPPPPVPKVATPDPVIKEPIAEAQKAPEPITPPVPVFEPAQEVAPVAVKPVVEEVVQEVIAEPPPPPSVMAPAPPKPKIATFPLEHKVREETSNPAASSTSRPVPLRPGVAGNLNDTVLSRPAPELDPATVPESAQSSAPVRDLTEETQSAPTEKKKQAKTAVAEKAPVIPGRKPQSPAVIVEVAAEVPVKAEEPKAEPVTEKAEAPVIPPRRPDNVQKAPPELVEELRAREAARAESEVAQVKETAKPKASIDLANPPPPPGPRGKKNMPAVAKAPVESEPLAEQTVKLPTEADPLLDRLIEKDKQSLVDTIESMVAAREDGKPLAGGTPKEKREQGTSIVKAEPMQRPYNVYRPAKADEESKIAAVPEEAVSVAKAEEPVVPRPPEPRSQDEEAYVSVPFSQGLTEVDANITSEIESRLLPVLNDNPGWKLQIQAFASPVKDGASSARKASLARAMSVRTFLLGKGIEANRMDIRALGAESDREPMDRVDLIVLDPAKKG